MIGHWSSEAQLHERAQALRKSLGLAALLLTRSEDGMSLFDDAGHVLIPAEAREVFDVTGAGDTVIATLATMIACGLGIRDAMPIANRAGGIVVGKFGTASVELRRAVRQRRVGMRVVVTGAAGMIGANLLRGLNAIGIDDIVAVDDLSDGAKYANLAGASIADYFDRRDFYPRFERGELGRIDAVFHEGACSDTMEHDGRLMLDLNYRCSKTLLDACQAQNVRLLYASSAAVYGGSDTFREEPAFERPLNVYGYSKLLFDNVVRRVLPTATTQVAGFRYFNVYGPHEQHKGRMASVAFHHFNQLRSEGRVKLFGPYGGYGAGEQARDFVFVDDVVAVNLWFLAHPEASGIFNLGSGRAQPFNDVAAAVVNAARAERGEAPLSLAEIVAAGKIEYIDFPAALVGKYQCFTEADLGRLRGVGCDHAFADVAQGVGRYAAALRAST